MAVVAPAKVLAVGAAVSAGVLVAEGDSWFDYPLNDVLSLLEDDYAYEVESVAHKGDRVEDMAYADGQLEELARRLEKLLRRNVVPRAILVSGGGNDIAGDTFAMLLNHGRSPVAGWNDRVVEGVIEERIKAAYVTILSSVTAICRQYTGNTVRIVIHGYDYPVADGRGFAGGWGPFPGPWLEPGFREKGFDDLAQRTRLMRPLIDRFNTMLRGLPGLPEFSHVRFVDLRGTLSTGADYKRWWANELHPTRRGFERVTARFAGALV